MKTYYLVAEINANLAMRIIELHETKEDAQNELDDLNPLDAVDERIFKVEVSLCA